MLALQRHRKHTHMPMFTCTHSPRSGLSPPTHPERAGAPPSDSSSSLLLVPLPSQRLSPPLGALSHAQLSLQPFLLLLPLLGTPFPSFCSWIPLPWLSSRSLPALNYILSSGPPGGSSQGFVTGAPESIPALDHEHLHECHCAALSTRQAQCRRMVGNECTHTVHTDRSCS